MENKKAGTILTKQSVTQSDDPRKMVLDEINRLWGLGYKYKDMAGLFNFVGLKTFSRDLPWSTHTIGNFARKMGTKRKVDPQFIPVTKDTKTTPPTPTLSNTVGQSALVQEIIDIVTAPMNEAYKVRLIRDVITNGPTA